MPSELTACERHKSRWSASTWQQNEVAGRADVNRIVELGGVNVRYEPIDARPVRECLSASRAGGPSQSVLREIGLVARTRQLAFV